MKTLIGLGLAVLSGCKMTGTIAVPRAGGTGTNYYSYLAVGGIIRPGVIVVFGESGGNGPPVMVNASGPPIAPSITGAAGNVAAAATLSGLWPDKGDSVSTTTVNQYDPRAPIMEPPKMPPSPPGRPAKSPHDNRPPHLKFPNRGH